jgi:hypothetical protein
LAFRYRSSFCSRFSCITKKQVGAAGLKRHSHRQARRIRQRANGRTVDITRGISATERKHLKLAPFIGIGCPGVIEEDGSIDRGAQNLPGNWESSKFNLPLVLHEMIPSIAEHEASIGFVQGLSEIPFMQDVGHWGVLTIGTGLGNARFTNRSAKEE